MPTTITPGEPHPQVGADKVDPWRDPEGYGGDPDPE